MSFKAIDFKVFLYAILIKFKKILNSEYDPFQPLPSNLYLNPSNIISEAYKSVSLDLTSSRKNLNPLIWQRLARSPSLDHC